MTQPKEIKTIADLTPDGDNFNKHTEFGQKLLEDSLRKFGAGRSVLVDRNGNIIAGNSTTETAAAIGMEDVEVVKTDGKKLVVVQRTDLDLDSPEGRELALADNMTAFKGIDMDLDKVRETLGDDLAKAWGMEIPEVQKQAQEDDFDPDKPVETVCKKGDIWKLGNHRLMCGDSTDAASVALLMDGKQARLVVTSPPYGVGKSYEEAGIEPWKKTIFAVIENITKHARIIVWNIGDLFATGTQFYEPTSMYSTMKMEECGFLPMYARIWKKQGGNFTGTNPYYTVTMKPVQEYEWILCYGKKDYEKDYKPIIEYMSQQAKIAKLDNAILKEITGAEFMFGHWFTTHQWAMMNEANYTKIQNYCKKNSIKAFEKDYDEIRRQYDNLNIFGKVLPKSEESEWGQWSIWNIATVNKRTGGHPAEFPVELPWRCIKMQSRDGDIVLDPFGGSGTTLIAAEQLNRKCFMMELDPHYCDVIIARWEKLTGNKSERISDGNE